MKMKVKAHINEIKKAYSQLSVTLCNINKNDDYTSEAKTRLKNEAVAKFRETRNYSINIINEAINSVRSGRPKVDSKSLEYQLGLSNTIKMLELGASSMDKDSVLEMVGPFINDKMAMNAFNTLLSNAGRQEPELQFISPDTYVYKEDKKLATLKDGIESQLNQLENLNYDVDSLGLGAVAFNNEFFLNGCIDYLENNFDANLGVLE